MPGFWSRRRGPDADARLRDAMDALRPLLPIEAVTFELVRYDSSSGVARVRMLGDCPDCDLRAMHLVSGIEARLRQAVPELRGVELIDQDDRLRTDE